MIHYKLIKITIDAPSLAKIIINVIVQYNSLLDLIVTDWSLLFISKFWLLLCYFLSIKRRLSTAFHPQINNQTERQNSTIKAYLKAFMNIEQNNWARLLLMIEFAYNNTKNINTGHTAFELNCGYHLWVFYKDNIHPHPKSKLANELLTELQKLMTIFQKNFYYTQVF